MILELFSLIAGYMGGAVDLLAGVAIGFFSPRIVARLKAGKKLTASGG